MAQAASTRVLASTGGNGEAPLFAAIALLLLAGGFWLTRRPRVA
jgi:LPXTG-motif cell wall-anchored protein